MCHNFKLGLMTKARACKGASQEGSPRVTFCTFGSVGECEGMNTHTPKWASTLGVGILMGSQSFKKVCHESKFIGLKISLYH